MADRYVRLPSAPTDRAAISGSFDTSAIRWSLTRNTAEQVLRFHVGAVNAVAIVDGDLQATAGEDGKIAIWRNGNPVPERTFEGHTAPIVSLAVSSDGKHHRIRVLGPHHPPLATRGW